MKWTIILCVSLFLEYAQCSNPNVLCIIKNCAKQSAECVADEGCRSAMMCITGCATNNQTCLFDCIYSYEDDAFDAFMKCASTDHQCITNDPPNPPVVCHPPQKVESSFMIDQLNGSWYIVKGLNPLYDCFDCQITTFNPSLSSKTVFDVFEKFDVKTVKGGVRHRSVNETVAQVSGGIFNYTSMMMGHNTQSQWRIVHVGTGNAFLLAYYCGSISADYFYEGTVVYSRSPTLTTNQLVELVATFKDLGWDYSKYCTPRTLNCNM
ncbi:uncharacterized protein LOC134256217 [Saccostrea cucullata]|uniref:uncharacterized protein LOC134256217 n=1 Tax=Saccostrea cuccullata TaxID=36930 RepID=UPI002ED56D27